MTAPAIAVRGLRVSYENTEVIHGIDLSVGEGEFVSIVGRSGCGKSTFLLALAGFIEASGSIEVPAEIGMVFQNYAVFPWLTVEDNIAFGLRHLPPGERDGVVARSLAMVDLKEHARKYPGQLSGGQTQRVALARALAPNPKVIFMDEPFGALDNFTRNSMQEWLGERWEQDHKTVLFVTHNIEEAMYLSDRILLFGEGTLCGDLSVPFARPRSTEIKFSPEFVQLRKDILDRLGGEEKVRISAR